MSLYTHTYVCIKKQTKKFIYKRRVKIKVGHRSMSTYIQVMSTRSESLYLSVYTYIYIYTKI